MYYHFNYNELEVGEVKVIIDGNYAYCYRNAGEGYGGIRETVVDCTGVDKDDILSHIEEYAGKIYSDYLRSF